MAMDWFIFQNDVWISLFFRPVSLSLPSFSQCSEQTNVFLLFLQDQISFSSPQGSTWQAVPSLPPLTSPLFLVFVLVWS